MSHASSCAERVGAAKALVMQRVGQLGSEQVHASPQTVHFEAGSKRSQTCKPPSNTILATSSTKFKLHTPFSMFAIYDWDGGCLHHDIDALLQIRWRLATGDLDRGLAEPKGLLRQCRVAPKHPLHQPTDINVLTRDCERATRKSTHIPVHTHARMRVHTDTRTDMLLYLHEPYCIQTRTHVLGWHLEKERLIGSARIQFIKTRTRKKKVITS